MELSSRKRKPGSQLTRTVLVMFWPPVPPDSLLPPDTTEKSIDGWVNLQLDALERLDTEKRMNGGVNLQLNVLARLCEEKRINDAIRLSV